MFIGNRNPRLIAEPDQPWVPRLVRDDLSRFARESFSPPIPYPDCILVVDRHDAITHVRDKTLHKKRYKIFLNLGELSASKIDRRIFAVQCEQFNIGGKRVISPGLK